MLKCRSDQGELLFLLVKGGLNYTCRIDIATGKATLAMGDGSVDFVGADGVRDAAPVGQTKIQGAGTYRVRYSNVDAEIRLWVNDQRVEFSGPTTYEPRAVASPGDECRGPWRSGSGRVSVRGALP